MNQPTLGASRLPIEHAVEPPLATFCRWLTALDGWATFYELDPAAEDLPAREPMEAYERAQTLYLLKEQSLQTLLQIQSPQVSLGLLEGPVPHTRIWLCAACKGRARQHDMSPREYADQTGGCPQCQRESRDRDYFSLYVVEVADAALGSWRFHTPVPLGRVYMPAPRSPQCPVIGQRPLDVDGRVSRLGSTLSASDRRRLPEPEVVWQVWQGLKQVRADSGM